MRIQNLRPTQTVLERMAQVEKDLDIIFFTNKRMWTYVLFELFILEYNFAPKCLCLSMCNALFLGHS